MGIDVCLVWEGMTEDDRDRQTYLDIGESQRRMAQLREMIERGEYVDAEMMMAAMAHVPPEIRGRAGYIREGYGVSPHPSAILVREAFEAADGKADIPAAVMRERLHGVTEPARNVGDDANALLSWMAQQPGMEVSPGCDYVATQPCSVWECVQQRVENAHSAGGCMTAADMMSNYTTFVELAERKEREQGHPCRVIVSQ